MKAQHNNRYQPKVRVHLNLSRTSTDSDVRMQHTEFLHLKHQICQLSNLMYDISCHLISCHDSMPCGLECHFTASNVVDKREHLHHCSVFIHHYPLWTVPAGVSLLFVATCCCLLLLRLRRGLLRLWLLATRNGGYLTRLD